MNLRWPARVSLAVGSGLALALAFPSAHFPLLAWLSVALLMIAVIGARLPGAVLYGFLHGAAFATPTLTWVATVMRVHGGVPPLAAAGILALMVAAFSVFPATFALAVAWLGRRSAGRACLAAPFVWVTLEFARTHLPAIGFPWNLLGYTASTNLALLQLAAWTGIYGLSLLVAGYNATLVWMVLAPSGSRSRAAMGWLLFTAALLLVGTVGSAHVPAQQPRYVAHLVQTNFPQSQSYPPDWMNVHAWELDELERLSTDAAARKPGLVVWSEVPAPFSTQDAQFTARAERIARESHDGFLLGIVDWKQRPLPGGGAAWAAYNGAILLDGSGRRVFLYDKIHLVAFGEYVPMRRWLTFADKLTADIGDFEPGSTYSVGTLPGGGKFGVFICFEAVFPDLVRRFAANGAEVFVNLSNDGWFGRSAAPEQHLMMARVRAVENRRWLLRGTNNGFTVSVDPYGRYAARLATDVRGALDAPYDLRSDRTLYTRWGDWVAWLSLAGAILLLAGNGRSRAGRKAA